MVPRRAGGAEVGVTVRDAEIPTDDPAELVGTARDSEDSGYLVFLKEPRRRNMLWHFIILAPFNKV